MSFTFAMLFIFVLLPLLIAPAAGALLSLAVPILSAVPALVIFSATAIFGFVLSAAAPILTAPILPFGALIFLL